MTPTHKDTRTVIEQLVGAIEHTLSGSLSLPRFAETELRAALTAGTQALARPQVGRTSMQHFAIRDANQIAAIDEYFATRSNIANIDTRNAYASGFIRGFNEGTTHPQASEPTSKQSLHVEAVGINGLTKAETSESMSVMGLSKPTVSEPAPSTAGEPRPVYGKPGTRDIDVAEAMKRWDAAHVQPAQGERAEAAIRLHDAWLYFTGAEPSLSVLGQAIDEAAALLQSAPDHIPDAGGMVDAAIVEGMGLTKSRKLQVTLIDTEADRFKRMFEAACVDLGLINEALGLDPNDGGAEPILNAIEELKEAKVDARPVGELTDEQTKILNFLLGKNSFNGLWYGERLPAKGGMYWWRDALRSAFAAARTQPELVPLTDDWIRARCSQSWVFESAMQWVRMAEAAHGITGGEQ